MPYIKSFEDAADNLANAANRLQAAGQTLAGARAEVSVERMYGLLNGVGGDLVEAATELLTVAARLRNAAAEFESLEEA